MRKLIFGSLITLLASCGGIDSPGNSDEIELLAGSNVSLESHLANNQSGTIFINLHEDEQTSIEVLKNISLDRGINYIYIKHDGTRRISFIKDKKEFNFDPNRIFTNLGRKLTLQDGGLYSNSANEEVAHFSQILLDKITPYKTVVAMHNNTEDNYSILSYKEGGSEEQNTNTLYINSTMDPDDFIYTTDKELFEAIATNEINVILQDNDNFVDDGSLSVYCGSNGIRYANIETQHGHKDEQHELMELLIEILDELE